MNKRKNKRKLRIIGLSIGLVSIIVFPPWKLVWAMLKPLPDTVQEQVNDALDYGFDGIIVYEDVAGKDPAFYAAGWHNRENKIPADPHALFKIASIGKLYDAVAITKLVGHGRLSLDQTLADYFPELVGRIEYADQITIRMLVQHRSGIPNFTNAPNFWSNSEIRNSQDALNLILDQPANFKPDEDYEYCNTNYLLLSLIMDKVLGYSHRQYIKEEILDPLDLHNTFSNIHEIDMQRLMSGYYVGIEEDIKTADYNSMVASAEDVGKFVRALNDGSVFGEGEQEIYSSIYVYDHTGLIPGYQSIAKYHKDIDAVVVQFTNTANFSDYRHWTLHQIVYNRIVKIIKKENKK